MKVFIYIILKKKQKIYIVFWKCFSYICFIIWVFENVYNKNLLKYKNILDYKICYKVIFYKLVN